MTTFTGTSGNDTFTGTTAADTFDLQQGGSDTASGRGGNDLFNMGGTLDASDQIDGGAGDDTVAIGGDYSGGLVFNATTMLNVETLLLAAGNNYNLTIDDATVAAGATLTVDASALGGNVSVHFDGTKERDGSLVLVGGAGDDLLTGGTYQTPATDTFNLQRGGNDTVQGGVNAINVVNFGSTFTAADRVLGHPGLGLVTVVLDGNYTGANAVTMNATTLVGVDTLRVSAGHSYTLTTDDAAVAAGATLTVDASALGAGDSLNFNGTAEDNGSFVLVGGAGDDVLTGGTAHAAVADTFNLQRGGNDTVRGGFNAFNIANFGSTFTAADQVLGNQGDTGVGSMTIVLDGNYTGAHAVTMNATTMVDVERLRVSAGHSYTLVSGNAPIVLPDGLQGMEIDGSALGAGDSLHFDGSAEVDGVFDFIGGAGNDVLIAAPSDEPGQHGAIFDLSEGGDDRATGSFYGDTFYFGAAFTAADRVDGVADIFPPHVGEPDSGLGDEVLLNGNYTGSRAVTLGAKTVANIEQFVFDPGHSYTLTTNDANMAAGKRMLVDGGQLVAGNVLTFDGGAETNGEFSIRGGAGSDVLTGGHRGDYFDLREGGSDTAKGGGGNDLFDLGGKLNAGDKINGGNGNDTVNLDGDYSAGVTFTSTTMRNVNNVDLGGGHDYTLTLADATIAAGKILSVDATAMAAGDTLRLDNTAATNGRLEVLAGGERDVIHGGAGEDQVNFEFNFTANDFFNGGAGDDFVRITKANSADMVLSNLKNIEALDLEDDNYHVTTTDGLVAAGKTLSVAFDDEFGFPGGTMWFDGSAETNGSFSLTDVNGGMGVDHLVGGAQDDAIKSGSDADFLQGGGGADLLQGGAGHDTYAYAKPGDSTSTTHDTIVGFNANGSDVLALHNDFISDVDHPVTHGTLSNATFDSDLAAAVNAAHLLAHQAVLFTPDAGSDAGQTFLVVDANGHAGYQAGADYVMRLKDPQHISELSVDSFSSF